LGEHFIVLPAWEGGLSEGEKVEDDAHAEQIADGLIFGLEVFEIDHLGSDIARCSTSNEHIVFAGLLGEAEVGDHTVEVSLLPEEDVFGLEVAVHDVVSVHDFQSLEDALHDHFDFLGRELVLGLDLVI